MRKLVTFLVALGLFALFVVGLLFPTSAANAAPLDKPSTTRPPAPSSSSFWGAPIDQLGSSGSGKCTTTTGGWTLNGAPVNSFVTLPTVGTTTPAAWNPRFIRLCEPYAVSSTRWGVPVTSVWSQVETAELRSTSWRVGAMTGSNAPSIAVICAPAQWSTPDQWTIRQATTVLTTGFSSSRFAGTDGGTANLGTAVTPQNCPYIVRIEMPVANGSQSWDTAGSGRMMFMWTADSWYTQKAYQLQSPLELICNSGSPAAASILTCSGFVPLDGSSFAVACAGAPLPTWGDFSWFPNVVGHYAECLFNPMNGFDRTGQAKESWERSQPGQVINAFNNFTDVVAAPGACGPIVTLPLDPTGRDADAVVNTCTWSWAGGMRTFLGFVVTVLGFIAVAVFFAKVWASVFGGPITSPVTNDEDNK